MSPWGRVQMKRERKRKLIKFKKRGGGSKKRRRRRKRKKSTTNEKVAEIRTKIPPSPPPKKKQTNKQNNHQQQQKTVKFEAEGGGGGGNSNNSGHNEPTPTPIPPSLTNSSIQKIDFSDCSVRFERNSTLIKKIHAFCVFTIFMQENYVQIKAQLRGFYARLCLPRNNLSSAKTTRGVIRYWQTPQMGLDKNLCM